MNKMSEMHEAMEPAGESSAEKEIPDYEVKEAYDTLVKARQIKGNEALMTKVKKLMGEHQELHSEMMSNDKPKKLAKSVADLRKKADSMK